MCNSVCRKGQGNYLECCSNRRQMSIEDMVGEVEQGRIGIKGRTETREGRKPC